MKEIDIVLRTGDGSRKAEVTLPVDQTGADVIQAAVDNWALPPDTDYSLVAVNTGKAITPTDSLEKSGIGSGDILEVQPVLVAG
jgi:hypothetical protein